MNYVEEWCKHVLASYLEESKRSLEARRDGITLQQLAECIFGPDFSQQEDFDQGVRWNALRQAVQDLEDQIFIILDRNYSGEALTLPAKITESGERFLENEMAEWSSWWAICAAAPALKPEQQELLRLVNHVSPKETEDYAWMEWVHQDTLRCELDWDLEVVRVVIQELRSSHDYVRTCPDFFPLGNLPTDELFVRATYQGVVLQTKSHLTIEAKAIDELVQEWETTSVEFKQELKTKTKDQKAEFVKDILGLANTQASGKRWLTVGFDDKSHAYHSAPDPNLSQDHLEQILAIYTEPMVEIRYDSIEHYEGPVGRIQVLRDSAKLPYEVAKSVGDHKRIDKGQIFVRHGSQTEEPTSRELETIQAEGERAKEQ